MSQCEVAREQYIDDLWFLLHHTESDDDLVLGLTLYFDDSGSDDGSSLVVAGGPALSRIQFKALSASWFPMLEKHGVTSPLSMKKFIGRGVHAGWYPEMKRALFLDVVKFTNRHKLFSLSVSVSQDDFKSELTEETRKRLIGPYAFAFFMAVIGGQSFSQKLKTGPMTISYLGDTGFGYQSQLTEAHAVVVQTEKNARYRYTGALAFDSDDRIAALQVADVIAWAARKRDLLGYLPEGFEPLEEILQNERMPRHTHIPIPKAGIKLFSDPLNEWILNRGAMPTLAEAVGIE